MAYTNFNNLEKDPTDPTKLLVTSGSSTTLKAIYYFKDLKILQDQPQFHRLVERHVRFVRNDVDADAQDITVLFAADSNGDIIQNDANDPDATTAQGEGLGKCALAWPPYYDNTVSHGGTGDYPGDASFRGGSFLQKS